MKTLTILAVILGIAFLFFVAKAEKSFVIDGNGAIPAGITGISKTLLDKVNDEMKSILWNNGGIGNLINLEPNSTSGDIITGAKNFISDAVDKVTEIIKTPIEDKVNSILCPQK